MNVSIIGAGNTKFGSFVEKNRETGETKDLKSLYELINEAGAEAIKDAGLEASEIDAVWVGSCSPSRFTSQEHLGPLAMEIDPEGLRFKPMVRTEAACASSSVAIHDAAYAVEAGRFKKVLVIGVEKMNLLNTGGVTATLAGASYWPDEGAQGMTFPGLFAELAKAYAAQYNLSPEALRKMFAYVSAVNYRYGIQNPLAHFGPGGLTEKKGLTTAEAILSLPDEGRGSNMMVAPPLRLHDCSLVSDGAAAVVLAPTEEAKSEGREAVELSGIGQATERMPIKKRRQLYMLEAGKVAVQRAYGEAGITAEDVDIAEVHDCFTINQLLCTEALGVAADGKSGFDYQEGRFGHDDNKISINLSGGLKAKGHPVGATGASMHAMLYRQLIGKATGQAPVRSPETGVVLNVGGSGVTNCVTVLKRV